MHSEGKSHWTSCYIPLYSSSMGAQCTIITAALCCQATPKHADTCLIGSGTQCVCVCVCVWVLVKH